MTPDERALLIAVSVRVAGAVGSDGNVDLGKLAEVVVLAALALAPAPPRPKYVAMKEAPDIKSVAARWKSQWSRDGVWNRNVKGGRGEEIYNQLVAMGDDPDREAVRKLMGNTSWTHLSCDGCDTDGLLRAVCIKDEYSDGHIYCPTCIREAAALLDSQGD